MKKTLSIILAVFLLISAFPFTAFAADTDTVATGLTVLYTADVTVDEPIAGQAPSIDGGSVPEGAGYYVGATVWSDEDGNNDFGTFVAGKEYSTMIVVYAKSGYVFDDTHLTMQGTVNGAEKTFLVSGDSAIYVACTFTCEGEPELLGDVDGDGEVSVIDATIIRRYEAGFNVAYSEADILRRGDVDDDGEAGVMDATLIQRFNAGFNVAYPIGEQI